jgi:transcriptional regulator with XRE-family HTH domain
MKAMTLTPEQLAHLKREPLGDAPNKIALALSLAQRTQRELAAFVGMTEANVSKIRNGNYRRLTLSTSQRIANAFGAATDDIFPPPPAAVTDRRQPKRIVARSVKAKGRSTKAPKARVAA